MPAFEGTETIRAMRLISVVYIIIFSLNLMPRATKGSDLPSRELLSISVTNKYGDVFTNLVVSKILSDGLVLEHKSGQLKVKYADLPADLREKYQPLAAAADQKEKQDAVMNAAFVAEQRKEQAEQARLRAARERQQLGQRPTNLSKLRISIPNQDWSIKVLDIGLRELGRQTRGSQFAYSASGPNGFNLSLFVEQPPGAGMENSDVFNFYWPKASRNPLIDENSIKTETRENFVRVTYTSLGIPNVNYYFAFKGRWVDLHISKSPFTREDLRLFAEFEANLSYGD